MNAAIALPRPVSTGTDILSKLKSWAGIILMAITTAMAKSFKVELGTGTHNFTASTGDTFKLALFTSSASLDADTTAYSSTNEVANGNGYTTGGKTLVSSTPVISGSAAVFDFADVVWNTATFTARGCQIYNSSKSNKNVATFDFGADKTATAADFTITMPPPDATNAVLRLT